MRPPIGALPLRDAVLALACALAAGVLLLEMEAPRETAGADMAVADAAAPGAPSAAPAGSSIPDRAALSETLERPLFNRSRRPTPADLQAQEAGPTTAGTPPVALTGVILDPHIRIAVLKRLDNQANVQLRLGQEIEGWMVTDIAADRVKFSHKGDTSVLVLKSGATRPASAE
ncbi:hypothetical protein [Azospirillum canadense]|uniref:hypothetical protein n=1 Tax=Azospirillum canadense TaxID=403962 RepID=UPI0022265EA1|nr:hypothetical protein [Azospirillum canadense]MCW2239552.1 hypothetical protein [Azospirillum canadense]